MELNPDFQEFLQSFVDHDVRFLIVGGYALAAHGHPRYTKDLDVWVWTDPSNAARVIEALDDFGFGGSASTQQTSKIPTWSCCSGASRSESTSSPSQPAVVRARLR